MFAAEAPGHWPLILAGQVEPVAVGQPDVEEHEIDLLGRDRPAGRRERSGRRQRRFSDPRLGRARQDHPQDVDEVGRIVLDHEQPRGHGRSV